jgi:hypothetical protein
MCAKVISIKKRGQEKEETTSEEPLEEYKKQVAAGTVSILPYDRLMIHYRKEKAYKEELKVIRKGIATLQKFYTKQQRSSLKKINPKITELSSKIGRSTGLLDKKGKDVYLPEPLPRWIKRQAVVEQKIKRDR